MPSKKVLDQRSLRRDQNVRDQFGRLYLTSMEQTEDGWESTEIVTAGWTDPLRTLDAGRKHFRGVKNEFGIMDPSRIQLDVKAWFDEVKAADRDWLTRFYTLGRDHYKNAFNPKDPQTFSDDFLLTRVGPKPFPSVAMLRQAFAVDANGLPESGKQRDAGLLGLQPLNKTHRALLGIPEPEDFEEAPSPNPPDALGSALTYKDFVKEFGIKDAPTKWAAHKAALQEA